MKISKSSLVLTAAFTGLLGGTVARAATVANSSRSGAELTSASSGISPIAGQRCRQGGKARLQGPEFLQGQGRLQVQRQRLQGQELLQGQGRLRHRRFQQITSKQSR